MPEPLPPVLLKNRPAPRIVLTVAFLNADVECDGLRAVGHQVALTRVEHVLMYQYRYRWGGRLVPPIEREGEGTEQSAVC